MHKHNAKGVGRPYKHPRGGGSKEVAPPEETPTATATDAPLAPAPAVPALDTAAARSAEMTTSITDVPLAEVDAPGAKRAKLTPEETDTGSADDTSAMMRTSVASDIFAPFLASLDLAEKAAGELLQTERDRWAAVLAADKAAHVEELRRVREVADASVASLSAELQEMRQKEASAAQEGGTALAEAQQALTEMTARVQSAEAAANAAMAKAQAAGAAATTLAAVRDAAAAALRRLEAV
jgi:hypothetical protein